MFGQYCSFTNIRNFFGIKNKEGIKEQKFIVETRFIASNILQKIIIDFIIVYVALIDALHD
jgi:hypothetical protein